MIPISNAQKNYLFILAILEDYATRSKFIQYINGVNVRFGVGPKDKINEVIKETPYMWVEDLGSTMLKADERHASAYFDFARTGKESDDWFYFRPVAQVGEYESLDYFPES